MAHGACHDQAREIEDRWIGSLGISSAIAAKSRDHRRTLLGVPIRISNLPIAPVGCPKCQEWVTGGKTRREYMFSGLPQVADIVRGAFQ
jgi:hypothetical protein